MRAGRSAAVISTTAGIHSTASGPIRSAQRRPRRSAISIAVSSTTSQAVTTVQSVGSRRGSTTRRRSASDSSPAASRPGDHAHRLALDLGGHRAADPPERRREDVDPGDDAVEVRGLGGQLARPAQPERPDRQELGAAGDRGRLGDDQKLVRASLGDQLADRHVPRGAGRKPGDDEPAALQQRLGPCGDVGRRTDRRERHAAGTVGRDDRLLLRAAADAGVRGAAGNRGRQQPRMQLGGCAVGPLDRVEPAAEEPALAGLDEHQRAGPLGLVAGQRDARALGDVEQRLGRVVRALRGAAEADRQRTLRVQAGEHGLDLQRRLGDRVGRGRDRGERQERDQHALARWCDRRDRAVLGQGWHRREGRRRAPSRAGRLAGNGAPRYGAGRASRTILTGSRSYPSESRLLPCPSAISSSTRSCRSTPPGSGSTSRSAPQDKQEFLAACEDFADRPPAAGADAGRAHAATRTSCCRWRPRTSIASTSSTSSWPRAA